MNFNPTFYSDVFSTKRFLVNGNSPTATSTKVQKNFADRKVEYNLAAVENKWITGENTL